MMPEPKAGLISNPGLFSGHKTAFSNQGMIPRGWPEGGEAVPKPLSIILQRFQRLFSRMGLEEGLFLLTNDREGACGLC